MRRTHHCPKCNHGHILHLTQVADRVGEQWDEIHKIEPRRVERGYSRAWRIARVEIPERERSIWKIDTATVGNVEAYCCKQCGFLEFYVRDPESIPVDGDVVRELKARDSAPYR